MLRATGHAHGHAGAPFDRVVLAHDERHLRRKVIALSGGERLLVDLPEPVLFGTGDRLLLEDGRSVEIVAADEPLYAVTPSERVPLRHLAWHLGNRHLPAQIDERRILIGRDHVIRAMLEGLGASVEEVVEPFQPVHGAYHGHGGSSHAGAGQPHGHGADEHGMAGHHRHAS